jgi:hypothetical protein
MFFDPAGQRCDADPARVAGLAALDAAGNVVVTCGLHPLN